MKIFFFALLISTNLFAVCSSPIERTDAGFGTVLTSARYNSELNTVFNRSNNLPGDCIADGTITSAKLAPGSVTTSKIADGSVTSTKIAAGAIPPAGRLLRVSSFTASGTWTKQGDVGSILVQLVGGGGASYHASSTAGSASSFGSHCTANGGARASAASGNGGAGGSALNGDINLAGGSGESEFSSFGGYSGGVSMMNPFGRGGQGNSTPGGGAGGYCAKLIAAENLNTTETVTVGSGGSNPYGSAYTGSAGIVIVYEYSK